MEHILYQCNCYHKKGNYNKLINKICNYSNIFYFKTPSLASTIFQTLHYLNLKLYQFYSFLHFNFEKYVKQSLRLWYINELESTKRF